MSVAVIYAGSQMNAERYAAVHQRLNQAGLSAPNGRLIHASFGPTDHLRVFSMFDSQENLASFVPSIRPILEELQVAGETQVYPVHNVIDGGIHGASVEGALGVFFQTPKMSTAEYDEIIQRLEDAGAGAADGRLFHACFGPAERLWVFDIFSSPAHFQKFGEKLIPILAALGVEPGSPDVQPLHNLVLAKRATAA